MGSSEAKRHDLYTGLSDVLGPERAETLMAYLPGQPASGLATTMDMDRLVERMDRFEMRMDRFEGALRDVNQRLDRLFLTMLTGLLAIIATFLVSVFF